MIGYIPCKGGSGAAPARLNETGAAPGSTAEKNKAASISAVEKQIVAALVRMPPVHDDV